MRRDEDDTPVPELAGHDARAVAHDGRVLAAAAAELDVPKVGQDVNALARAHQRAVVVPARGAAGVVRAEGGGGRGGEHDGAGRVPPARPLLDPGQVDVEEPQPPVGPAVGPGADPDKAAARPHKLLDGRLAGVAQLLHKLFGRAARDAQHRVPARLQPALEDLLHLDRAKLEPAVPVQQLRRDGRPTSQQQRQHEVRHARAVGARAVGARRWVRGGGDGRPAGTSIAGSSFPGAAGTSRQAGRLALGRRWPNNHAD